MKRSPLSRRTPLARSGPVKPKNAKRRKREFERAYGGASRVEWIKTLPCVVASPLCQGPIENMHVRGGGVARKADARFIAPACHGHHAQLHLVGKTVFEKMHRVNLDVAASVVEDMWQRKLARENP